MHGLRRSLVLLVLVGLAGEAWGERSALEALLQHGDPTKRLEAVNRLAAPRGRTTSGKATTLLTGRLGDVDASVRRGALNALVARGARQALSSVRARLAAERHPEVLPALVLAVGRLGDASDVARLTPYARTTDPTLRASAITALSHLGGTLARGFARSLLAVDGKQDPAWVQRSTAILALARCGTAADLPRIQAIYRGGDGIRFWLARSAYVRAVERLAPDPLPVLEGFVEDEDARVAITAAAGLARRGEQARIQRFLEAPEASLRVAALGGVQQGALRGLLPRVRALAEKDPSRHVRWACAKVLFALDDPAGDRLMVTATQSTEPGLWMEAVALLAARTGEAHGQDAEAWTRVLAERRPAPQSPRGD